MPIRQLSIAGYRSIRELSLELSSVNVITGPNGCGKSNLYNAVVLLSKAAEGGFAKAIAAEGGMPSILWAGGERVRLTSRAAPKRLKLRITTDDYEYELQCGLPQLPPDQFRPGSETLFKFDPRMKVESLKARVGRGVTMMDRKYSALNLRNAEGRMTPYPLELFDNESVLSQIQESDFYPELSAMRGEIRRWRFYHHFRTDSESLARQPQVGSLTPVLSADASDLAAAIQTIVEIGDHVELREAIDRAFPGARLEVRAVDRMELLMHMPGIRRPLTAREVSDGTLRYLCLTAALLTPRPPELPAFNEPESSLHPDLIPALARLIARAAKYSQLWITTHSRQLAEQIEQLCGQPSVELKLVEGETQLAKEPESEPDPC